jgi:hypothetical protein
VRAPVMWRLYVAQRHWSCGLCPARALGTPQGCAPSVYRHCAARDWLYGLGCAGVTQWHGVWTPSHHGGRPDTVVSVMAIGGDPGRCAHPPARGTHCGVCDERNTR